MCKDLEKQVSEDKADLQKLSGEVGELRGILLGFPKLVGERVATKVLPFMKEVAILKDSTDAKIWELESMVSKLCEELTCDSDPLWAAPARCPD